MPGEYYRVRKNPLLLFDAGCEALQLWTAVTTGRRGCQFLGDRQMSDRPSLGRWRAYNTRGDVAHSSESPFRVLCPFTQSIGARWLEIRTTRDGLDYLDETSGGGGAQPKTKEVLAGPVETVTFHTNDERLLRSADPRHPGAIGIGYASSGMLRSSQP